MKETTQMSIHKYLQDLEKLIEHEIKSLHFNIVHFLNENTEERDKHIKKIQEIQTDYASLMTKFYKHLETKSDKPEEPTSSEWFAFNIAYTYKKEELKKISNQFYKMNASQEKVEEAIKYNFDMANEVKKLFIR